jgi:hypothetical protein
VNRFKLRPDLTFTPDGERYLVCDESTRSTFRVGALEYQILMQFEEKSNLDEVRYLFRAQHGREVPFETLKKFIHKAISLNLVEAESDSVWSRLAPSTAFTLKIKLFDPNRILDVLVRKLNPLFNVYGVAAAGALLLAAVFVLAFNLGAIFSFARFRSPGYIGLSIVAVVVLAIGHELAHGLVGKRFGFDVSTVGFHLHYFMPSFFCRIFRRADASRRSLVHVLLAGSMFDLILISLLLVLWRTLPTNAPPRVWISVVVTAVLTKVFLIQLNPLWPFSDGYHLFTLMIPNFIRRGKGKKP